jgi:metal-responsive CopG/Arc/MetJ family transcriptional regulator
MSEADLVEIIVRNVPSQLLKDFDQAITGVYPGGRSEAIRDLIRQFIKAKNEEA